MIRKYYVPSKDIEVKLRDEFIRLINYSTKLSRKEKDDLVKEVAGELSWDENYNSNFNAKEFIEDCAEYSVVAWKNENQNLVDLWSKVVVESSKHSSQPDLIADEVIKRFKDNFYIKE